MSIAFGFLLFPRMTQLDFAGPFEVFARVPGATVHLAAKTLEPVESDTGLRLLPSVTLQDCPQLDVLCVPGGPEVGEWFEDAAILDFLRQQAAGAKYVSSVCTGSLILGAAGLLEGYRAATHWTSLELLRPFGAEPVNQRVVVDRNRVTGGGVTAGIDFALTLVAELLDPGVAKMIQLGIEYDPAPPFDCGHPQRAEPEVLAALEAMMHERMQRRRRQTEASAARRKT